MQRPPMISIITPSYNQAEFIERTIRSVLEQDYRNVELIIVDGGSADGTVDILKKQTDERIRWVSERDAGQTDAINKGMRMATGDILAYLNSDDVYAPGALRAVAGYFSEHPDVLWVTGRCRIIDENDNEVRHAITAWKNFLLRRLDYRMLLVTNPISQPATFWRRSLAETIGPFDASQHFVMDYDYWLRAGKVAMPAVLQQDLAAFRVYTTSKTSSAFLRSFRQELEVAKRYSSSFVLNSLHWLNYLGIAAAYLLLNGIARLRTKR